MRINRIFLVTPLLVTSLIASIAFQKPRVFTQPDGSTFQGVLKGDSALNWIESDGKVVVYNPQDKYYYEAIIDEEKGLVPSSKKIESTDETISSSSSFSDKRNSLSQEQQEKLKVLMKKKHQGNYPR